jgi:uncharacterized membrane protein YjgN (DUF898 family)
MTAHESTQSGGAGIYFVFALITFVVLAIYAPWAALVVVGYAYASPIRNNRRFLIFVWVIGIVLTLWFLIVAIGLLFPSSTLDVGPVHQVN